MAGNVEFQNKVQKRLDDWLLDYAYWYSWEEFANTKVVDVNTTRDFVQWILAQVDQKTIDHCRIMKSLVLGALCMLSDGIEYSIRYRGDSELTVLEVLLQTYDNICEHVSFTLRQMFLDFIPAIKLQAVLVCCRRGDFENGWKVYQRQWQSSTVNETMKKEIVRMLKTQNQNDTLLKSHTYDEFLDKIFTLLKKVNEKFQPPYLVTLAKSFENEESAARKDTYIDIRQKRPYHASDLDRASKNSGSKISRLMSDDEKTLQKKVTAIREKRVLDNIKIQQSPLKRKLRDNEKNNTNRNADVDLNSSSDSDFEDTAQCPDHSLKSRVNGGKPLYSVTHNKFSFLSFRRNRDRVLQSNLKWLTKETEDFYKAVQELGVGNWAMIKDHLNTLRTNVQLKDKWRSLNKSGEIKELENKFGPV